MKAQVEIQKLLQGELIALKAKNPSFSLRAFSRRLGIPFSALSDILNGKRAITNSMGKRILEGLCVDPSQSHQLLKDLGNSNAGTNAQSASEVDYIQLDTDQFNLISEWHHYAIFSLAETDDFQDDPKWIASRLNIRFSDAQLGLERLERLGLLKRDESGRLSATYSSITTSVDITNLSLRKRHYQNLELARESLENDPLEQRDFSFITMSGDPKKIPELKERIQKFRRELCQFFETDSRKEVFQLCVQLFPLSELNNYNEGVSNEDKNSI